MNRSLSLALVVVGAAAGLAFARTSSPQDPMERLSALEHEVATLQQELAELKRAPAAGLSAEEAKTLKSTLERLDQWVQHQAQAASALDAVLDDSQAKGFTYGINAESRTVLLQGFHDLAASLRSGVPTPAAEPAPAQRRPQPPERPARQQK